MCHVLRAISASISAGRHTTYLLAYSGCCWWHAEPGAFEEALAEMRANDVEFAAWRETEARGTIGGW